MSGGFRSRLGFWFGGASKGPGSPPPPSNGSYRSWIGFWLGGLAAAGSTVPPDPIGYPSYFCPWLGGIGTANSLGSNFVHGSMTEANDSMRGIVLMTGEIEVDERYLFEFPLR